MVASFGWMFQIDCLVSSGHNRYPVYLIWSSGLLHTPRCLWMSRKCGAPTADWCAGRGAFHISCLDNFGENPPSMYSVSAYPGYRATTRQHSPKCSNNWCLIDSKCARDGLPSMMHLYRGVQLTLKPPRPMQRCPRAPSSTRNCTLGLDVDRTWAICP